MTAGIVRRVVLSLTLSGPGRRHRVLFRLPDGGVGARIPVTEWEAAGRPTGYDIWVE